MPTELEPILQRLNWVDYGVLLIVFLAVLSGIQRGFIVGALDLLGLGATLVAAVVGYRPVAAWLVDTFDVPMGLASVGALIGIAVLTQTVYWWVLAPLLRSVYRLIGAVGPLAALDRLLGVVPGAIQGIVLAGLLLLPFGLLPIVPSVSAGIERSFIGSWLVNTAVANAPEVESRLGRDLAESFSFLAPPQAETGRALDLGRVGTLEPDPEAEQRMLELLNQARQSVGLSPLVVDEALREVARGHSREMFERSYFSHTSPVTGSPADRARQAGIRPRVIGENLAYAPNVRIAHEGLMDSPGHRENILRPTYGRVGIGIIKSQFRGSMYTQNFRD
jgi:uncharacterized protein YkwD